MQKPERNDQWTEVRGQGSMLCSLFLAICDNFPDVFVNKSSIMCKKVHLCQFVWRKIFINRNIDPCSDADRLKKTGANPTNAAFTTTAVALMSPMFLVVEVTIFLKMGCLGWGANPGSFDFVYFLIPSLYR
jgi:hypothetical protein